MKAVTVTMTTGMQFEAHHRNTFSQTSTNIDSAVRGVVAQMNQQLDMYREGTELMCNDFESLLDYCVNSDGDVKLTVE